MWNRGLKQTWDTRDAEDVASDWSGDEFEHIRDDEDEDRREFGQKLELNDLERTPTNVRFFRDLPPAQKKAGWKGGQSGKNDGGMLGKNGIGVKGEIENWLDKVRPDESLIESVPGRC